MATHAELLQVTGAVLRKLRQDAGLSQEELAARAELSRSTIDKCERRERLPSLEILIKLANGLNTKASEIVLIIEEELKK